MSVLGWIAWCASCFFLGALIDWFYFPPKKGPSKEYLEMMDDLERARNSLMKHTHKGEGG